VSLGCVLLELKWPLLGSGLSTFPLLSFSPNNSGFASSPFKVKFIDFSLGSTSVIVKEPSLLPFPSDSGGFPLQAPQFFWTASGYPYVDSLVVFDY